MSKIPIDKSKLKKEHIDWELLRAGIVSEIDAINLYEQSAATTTNSALKTIFLDIAKEEKTHIGEFEALLVKLDREQKVERESGRKEVEEKTA